MDKKTVLAFLIIGMIIILMPYYFKMISPPQEQESQADQETMEEYTHGEKFQPLDTVSEGKRYSEPEAPIEEYPPALTPETPEGAIQWQDSLIFETQAVTVETPYYLAKIDCEGAKFISFKLKKFSNRRGGITELIKTTPEDGFYNNAYLDFYRMGLSTADLKFESSLGSLRLSEGEAVDLVLTARLRGGGYIRNIYHFNGNDYRIEMTTEASGVRLDDYYFAWDGSVNITEPDTLDDIRYSKAYAMMGGELEKLDAPGRGERRMNPTGTVDWMAMRSKYFIIGVIPQGNSEGIDFVAEKLGSGNTAPKEFKLAIRMENPGGKLNQKYTLYMGPIDSKRLTSLGVGMEATMNWGMSIIKPFSKLALWAFKLLHEIIPNYGVVIIVFSILIKVILWPLTHKSYVSMRKMSKLQPFIKEIREKYKSDPQKMQKATAQLYKEHKVNPMGGCLPTLLQMPLLFALFIVFRSTIELRGEPFALWIKDLSLPDTILNLGFSIPLYGSHVTVLPILMGISTFLQSRQTMTDPNQKMMVYFMPIFLVLMFNNFPSGLTLYYTLFNVLSYVQQKMIPAESKVEVVKDSDKNKK